MRKARVQAEDEAQEKTHQNYRVAASFNELLVHASALLGNRPESTWPIFGASLD